MSSPSAPVSDGTAARRGAISALFAAVLDGTPADACAAAERRAADGSTPAFDLGLAAISAVHALEAEEAVRLAGMALDASGNAEGEGRALAAVAALFAGAGLPGALAAPEPSPEIDAALAAAARARPTTLVGDFLRYQEAEAHLACGRIDRAARLVDAGAGLVRSEPADAARDLAADSIRTIGAAMRIRTLLFAGRVDEANEEASVLHAALLEDRVPAGFAPLVLATRMLVAGNADERALSRELLGELDRLPMHPGRGYLASGVHLLMAYGFLGIGDVPSAAREVHLARAAGPLLVVDDALAIETLVALATAEGDLGAAEAWLQLAEPIAGSRIARPAVLRSRSRVRLLEGDAAAALADAELAAGLAEAEGRRIEAAEAQVVAARARIAAHRPGEAVAALERLLEISDAAGHRAARRAAAQEMRAAGRRLRPPPGSEWNGLSERERDVALLIAAGLSNPEIAATLFLSPHTVRAHVSRVLAAFSAASRLTVAVRVAELLPPPDAPPPELTARQHAVAAGVARGLGNAAIAAELGISVKTVEKHLTEIHRRWGVRTRTGVARLVGAPAQRAQPGPERSE